MRRSSDGFSFSATEVAAFLACQHLTALELRVADGELTRPAQNDIERRMLEKRGLEHEARVLDHYRKLGREIVTIGAHPGPAGLQAAAERTLQAMQAGADLICQGALITGADSGVVWVGRPDFLQKVPGGTLWPHHYEAVDAKLSREAKAQAVLQLCAYSDQLHEIQGVFPEHFQIVGGGSETVPQALSTAHYAAYFRSVRRRMQAFVASAREQQEPYPEPVEHCAVCRYWKRCEDRRRADDHLSLVAGITRRQRDRLSLAGVGRLEELARLAPDRKLEGILPDSLTRIREQAGLQLRGRQEGRARCELLPLDEPGVGLEALPLPTPGDLFLDLEGDSFVIDGGLEYLFGLLDFGEPELDFTVRAAPGPARYRAFWATSSAEEKRAFEQVIDRVLLGRQEFERLHLFHFGHREADALKKLSCRHATREAEVDQLLRDGVLVDLLPIVRHGLRASVESYSLKQLEALYDFQRSTELRDAARAMQLFGWWLETGDENVPLLELRSAIQSYNRDDCLSTAALRNFLELCRDQLATSASRPLTRPERLSEKPPEQLSERQRLAADLARRLTENPVHPRARERRLLADLLEFHRREEKSGFWDYFRAVELAPADRLEDKSAIAGLSYVGEVGKIKLSTLHRYEFPEQEHSLRSKPSPIDPDTEATPGTVTEIGLRHVLIKRGPRTSVPHPRALIVGKPIDSRPLPGSLLALGEALAAEQPGFEAAQAFLFRAPLAAAGGGELLRAGETVELSLGRLSAELQGGVLAVQGPPGSGKTYQAALMILGLLKQGKRIGVTANSHAVVKHLLEGVYERAEQEGALELVRGLHLEDDDDDTKSWPFRVDDDKQRARQELETGRVNLLGGTAWTWARDDYAGSVDALVIDEAGQMSLANALAVARAGRGLVLFGDPAQLEQPQKGVHPPGAEVSALEHWLGGDALTIPPKLGVFLPHTRRLHPRICSFISQTFYEGRLSPAADLGLGRQELLLETEPGARDLRDRELGGSGLRYVPVEHHGNSNQSSEEVAEVARLVERVLAPSVRFRERTGELRVLEAKDVMVAAPYNAQVAALRRALPADVRVGTVDRFQGQEAAVVIYSMTSSSAEDAPRGLEFLFSPNRLNVAVSRAQALCILVASPELSRASCKTPRQIRVVNALCAFLEHAAS
ncbi:MAG TPA: TM0106 family RecB-like putative nuclease [Polyangiaceae bacterium]|nr:TM0106 family RecB-like putative nuclease [Polyangiaceae bacterium]